MSTPEIDSDNYDDELWQEVRHSVEEKKWEQVASAAAIFVEDKIRRWAGTPTDNGRTLVGQELMSKVFGEGQILALGDQPPETMGWRNLGLGFAAATSNVDRHHRQTRSDIRKYALGVLGLASLLLTQIRYTYPDLSKE
jgi:hypothetical protein